MMMVDAVPTLLSGWQSFYVIVGSSGGALIGLQFVVMALVAQLGTVTSHEPIRAYSTPTVVHFGTALLIAAIMCAPWPSVIGVGIALRIVGFAGVCYVGLTLWRAIKQSGYKPVWEDWLWHSILPFVAYAALLVGPFELIWHATAALFVIGGATLFLLYIGIHNAWDTGVYLVVEERQRARAAAEGQVRS